MSWFTPDQLARSEAYHGPLFRADLLRDSAQIGALALVGFLGIADGVGSSSPTIAAAVEIGVAVAVVTAPFGLAAAWWREVHHEPTAGLGRPPAAITWPVRRPIIAAVVVADQVVQALRTAVLVTAAIAMASWWSTTSVSVGLGWAPLVIAVTWPLAEWVEASRRRRIDQVTAMPEPFLGLLDGLLTRARSTAPHAASLRRPVCWSHAHGRLAVTGERAYVQPGPRRARIVVDASLAALPSAALEAVAAHELGHVRALVGGWSGMAWRAGARGAAALVLGVVLRIAVPGGRVDLVDVAAVAVLVSVAAPWSAVRSRRCERDADCFAGLLLADPASSAEAVRELLIDAGADLRPIGLRRLLARYPGAEERLDALVGRGPATRTALLRGDATVAAEAWPRGRRTDPASIRA